MWREAYERVLLVNGAHLLSIGSAKRAPTRSECFKNLSAQCDKHCSSFEDKALLVKSLQHAVKHRSTRLEYIYKKSCICFFSKILDI